MLLVDLFIVFQPFHLPVPRRLYHCINLLCDFGSDKTINPFIPMEELNNTPSNTLNLGPMDDGQYAMSSQFAAATPGMGSQHLGHERLVPNQRIPISLSFCR